MGQSLGKLKVVRGRRTKYCPWLHPTREWLVVVRPRKWFVVVVVVVVVVVARLVISRDLWDSRVRNRPRWSLATVWPRFYTRASDINPVSRFIFSARI